MCQHLDQILYNSYIGIGSKFLKEQIEKQGGNFKQIEKASADDPSGKQKTRDRVWAGSLHINPKELGKKKQKRSAQEDLFGESRKQMYKKKAKGDIIKEYFAEITTVKALSLTALPVTTAQPAAADADGGGGGTTVKIADAEAQQRELEAESDNIGNQLIGSATGGDTDVAKERAITGKVTFTKMQQDRVIKRADNVRYDYEVLKNSIFSFNDNGKGGYLVELVYKEPRSTTLKNLKLDQVVLENFEITRDVLVEMRRNFACHSTSIFGMLHFRVHELVVCLNRIVAMNDIFASLSVDENGYQLKREIKDKPADDGKGGGIGNKTIEEEVSDDQSAVGAAN